MDRCVTRCRDRVAALAADALPRAQDERDLVALLEGVWALVAEEHARSRAAGAPEVACAPGCAACCTINVGTLAIEGVAAAALLRPRVPLPKTRQRAATLHAFHDRVRWLEDRERVTARLRCPLLDEGARCTIHPARPLACRSVSALDPAECRRALSAGDEDGPGLVRMDLLQRALHDEARAALAEALAAHGLDARCRDVSGMAAVFLADPELVPAFLAGERVPIE